MTVNGENDFEGGAGEFDPIQNHHYFCPWVNGNVAAAGCSSGSSSASTSVMALSGWQLTLDALDAYHSLGHIPNQTLESESAASLYKASDHPYSCENAMHELVSFETSLTSFLVLFFLLLPAG